MKAIKVQFKPVGKKYFFAVDKFNVADGSFVVVETVRGVELGRAVGEPFELSQNELTSELKSIKRLATKDDLRRHDENVKCEKDNIKKCKELAKKANLEMKIVGCEYTLDRSKIIVYFEADDRIDFRELLKYLADEFKVRIELRQIGSRDGAKMIGGLGPCGRPMCCGQFINEFDNVSIKMAKVQNLSLNPQKISGTCGKLLCCIKHENEVYLELSKELSGVGDIVKFDNQEGKIISVNVLGQKYQIKFPDGKVAFVDAKDTVLVRKKKVNQQANDKNK